MANNSHFQAGSGVYACDECGKRTRGDGDCASLRLCRPCYVSMVMDNCHADGFHKDKPESGCLSCYPVEPV